MNTNTGDVIGFDVTGTGYDGRQRQLDRLNGMERGFVTVSLEPDPGNEHDRNAIKVMASIWGDAPEQVGWVPADIAKALTERHCRLTVVKWSLTRNGWYGGTRWGMSVTVRASAPRTSGGTHDDNRKEHTRVLS